MHLTSTQLTQLPCGAMLLRRRARFAAARSRCEAQLAPSSGRRATGITSIETALSGAVRCAFHHAGGSRVLLWPIQRGVVRQHCAGKLSRHGFVSTLIWGIAIPNPAGVAARRRAAVAAQRRLPGHPAWQTDAVSACRHAYCSSCVAPRHRKYALAPRPHRRPRSQAALQTHYSHGAPPCSCAACDQPGATLGCRISRCPRTYHLPCARRAGCRLNDHNYHVACPEHAPLFSHEQGAAGAGGAGGAGALDAW
jgi:hypothetical protein